MSHQDDDDFSVLVRRLSQAPSLNGGWDRMRSDITGLEGDIKEIRRKLSEQEKSLVAIDLKLGVIAKLGWLIIGAVTVAVVKEIVGLL